jgi:hypothetical protein
LYAQANACFYLLLGEKEIWLSFAFFGVIFEKYFFFSSLACILQKIQNSPKNLLKSLKQSKNYFFGGS